MDYETAMGSIWVIEVVNGHSTSYLSAVSIDHNRILTCADVVTDKSRVFGTRLDNNRIRHELQTVHVRSDWGLRLLRCKNSVAGGGEFLKISEDETLDYLDDVSHIGHPRGLIGSGFFGYASYPCIKVDPLSFSEDNRVCSDHRVSMYDQVAPPYRKMGDFVNVGTFAGGDVANSEFNRHLHPMVPVIQCAGAMQVETGCFGGPLFRKKTEDLVGIVTHRYGMYCTAVHVSAIKAFVAEAAAISIHENVGVDGSEASTSRES